MCTQASGASVGGVQVEGDKRAALHAFCFPIQASQALHAWLVSPSGQVCGLTACSCRSSAASWRRASARRQRRTLRGFLLPKEERHCAAAGLGRWPAALQGADGQRAVGCRSRAAAWRQDGALAPLPRLGKRRCCTAGCKQAPKDRRLQPSGPGSLAPLEQGLGTRPDHGCRKSGSPAGPGGPNKPFRLTLTLGPPGGAPGGVIEGGSSVGQTRACE